MNNTVDTLFASVFAIAFVPVLAMYLAGIVSEMMDRPTRFNPDMIMPPAALLVAGVVAGLCALTFDATGFSTTAVVVFAGTVSWIIANIVLVAVSTFDYAH